MTTPDCISIITWTVYGKIESITKTDGTTIVYNYDATGNRITKAVTKGATTTTTAYVRDARGNVLSIYTTDAAINSGHLTQSELHLYACLPDRQGSSRLGIFHLNKDLSIAPSASINLGSGNSGGFGIFERNKKFFELSNHLGNVLATVSDKKIGVDADNNGLIDYYTADVTSAQDYFPFGMMMPGRKYASGEYRYGFNGKENDKDISAGAQDYGMRINDSRLGRFLSVDPLASEFPSWSPYSYGFNNPIFWTDPTGAAPEPPSTDVRKNDDGSYTVVGAYDDGDKNIYVVGANGKRTGETIGTTMQPTDFMSTDDKTGGFSGYVGTTFNLNNLTVTGSVRPNKHTTATIYGADAQRLLDWGKELFRTEVTRQSSSTFYGELEILRDMSRNYKSEYTDGQGSLDFKSSLGLPAYTAIKAGNTSDGKPIITTLRAVGNITYGANMRSTKPYLLGTPTWYYSKVMKEVGAYNQSQNKGGGYNSGFPYFGEHTYSGSYIYYGYFGKFYKK